MRAIPSCPKVGSDSVIAMIEADCKRADADLDLDLVDQHGFTRLTR